jgi:hypothetical protein
MPLRDHFHSPLDGVTAWELEVDLDATCSALRIP